ncbi:bifunctional NAD(P)H-hydrate repair enzyme [Nitratireductor aestuarii]|uniref:Bifunctional NAD(P)H-hydrate repair enzyme n=1 Tax=Nitratireductor aestuarii TaxID=1735103 RepID=A0A916W5F2_9HYPH|nr:NAD(P)H-hydrate dehydratase [Nitratireductor aestuarii]GGA69547.1 bifunctional NAD(P)H-hydrate repair enzyme [Nitratireductor aestuarii]
MHELLTPQQMAEADRLAAECIGESYPLMLRAGEVLAQIILERFVEVRAVDVLCGPGNNGGDGYVLATILREHGLGVRIWRAEEPAAGTDAARAAGECTVERFDLASFQPDTSNLVVDALFGAGLARPLEGVYGDALRRCAEAKAPILAVDLPSGVSGGSGQVIGTAAAAELTVTFFRKKPGHLLFPGRSLCGEVVVADIGIPGNVLQSIDIRCHENLSSSWRHLLPRPSFDSHKYRRGHVGVFSGGTTATGAARMSAMAAARAGAGAVTLLSPASALAVNAVHLTSIMLRRIEDPEELSTFLNERELASVVLGPGFGLGEKVRNFADVLLRFTSRSGRRLKVVLDADALTGFAGDPEPLFEAAKENGGGTVLTPHEGEFARIFPDIAAAAELSKVDRARQAAERSGAVMVLKGADTVIAYPDGQAAINSNGTPYLATAGSGDVLAGMIAGLMAQGMPPFEAACAAVYLHAETARSLGPGLIAEDLPARLPVILSAYLEPPARG